MSAATKNASSAPGSVKTISRAESATIDGPSASTWALVWRLVVEVLTLDAERDSVLTDPGALEAFLVAADITAQANQSVTDLANQSISEAVRSAELQTTQALDFANSAEQPDGGATREVVMILAFAAVGVAAFIAWSARK